MFIISYPLSFLQMRWIFLWLHTGQGNNYLLVGRRAVFIGQFKCDLSTHQLIGEHLDLVLNRNQPTRSWNGYRYLILLHLQFLCRPVTYCCCWVRSRCWLICWINLKPLVWSYRPWYYTMQAGWYSKLDYQLHRVARDCDIYWHLGPDEFAEGMVVLQ